METYYTNLEFARNVDMIGRQAVDRIAPWRTVNV